MKEEKNRRVFHVDVGDMSIKKAKEYCKKLESKLKEKEFRA